VELNGNGTTLARLILQASDREQRQIGQELHDGLCQELAGIAFMLQSMQRKLADAGAAAAADADEISLLLRKAVSHARGLSHGLYPVAPEPNGLAVALARLADDTADGNQLKCKFRNTLRLDSTILADAFVTTNLYRIAQEAVRESIGVRKANAIKIELANAKSALSLRISDNGSCATANEHTCEAGTFTLMAQRAALIDATLALKELRAGGSRLICTLALRPN
jgi:two-component system, LuxR family, sensor kinase FixL